MAKRTVLSGVMALFVVGILWLPVIAAERQAFVIAAADEIPLLSQAQAQQLRTSIPRATMVNALLTSPVTRTLLLNVASKAGIAAVNVSFRSLAAKPIRVDAARSLLPFAAAAAEYAKCDWSAGVFFNPFFPPKYASDKYNLGEYSMDYANIRTEEEGIVRFRLHSSSYTLNTEYSIISLLMELPTGPAAYALALNLTDSQGNSPATWVSSDPRLAVTLWSGGKEYPVALTTLAGQPGYVGIVSADIVSHGPSMGSKMRAQSASIFVRFTMLPGKPGAPNLESLIFGGVTLTRI